MKITLVYPKYGKKWHIDHAWGLCFLSVAGMDTVGSIKEIDIDADVSVVQGALYTIDGRENDVCKLCCKAFLLEIKDRTDEEKEEDRRLLSVGKRMEAMRVWMDRSRS
jgi:hypothetical protein